MSRYHKGDKFIVEIKEVMESDNGRLYRSNFKTLTFDDNGLDKLQKYNEPNPIYIEQAKKCLETEAYNKGLEDAWKLANRFNNMAMQDIINIYGLNIDRSEVFDKLTPQEALAKLEAYEKAQAEIKVGDVVEYHNDNCATILVTHLHENNETFNGIDVKGKTYTAECLRDWKKTGKHIDLTDLFKQIGGGE